MFQKIYIAVLQIIFFSESKFFIVKQKKIQGKNIILSIIINFDEAMERRDINVTEKLTK